MIAASEEEWDALLGDDSLPFDRHCWYAAWWEAFGEGSLAVCEVREGGALRAALPLRRRGAELGGLANEHTPTFRAIGDADAAWRAALAGDAPVVRALALPADEAARVAALAAPRRRVLREPVHRSPFVDTRGDVEAWRARARPRELERLRRKMLREHGAQLSITAPPHDLDAQLEAGLALEAAGWKGRAGTAILSDPATATFYRRIARAFAAHGELRISEVFLDGRLAAFDLALEHRGRLYPLKMGYDEAHRKLKPGRVLQLATIEHCFAAGLRSLEMLGDAEPWKLEFADGVRPHEALAAYRGAARYAWRARVRPALKRLARR